MGEAKSKKIKIKKEIDEIIIKRSEAKSNYKEAVEKIKNAAKLAKMEVEKEERRLLSKGVMWIIFSGLVHPGTILKYGRLL